MTNMMEPRIAAGRLRCDSNANQDGELTSLIRRWMAAGGKSQRARDNGFLRIAPEPVEASRSRST